ncbi:rhamnan synthesis F family protein [Vibrio penaeicida]|uniref:Polysaccharide biosynthesis-like protein n=2 Tax=Vibrio penaeicida TaxID=104609 RepID=A0AAV5NWE1_9VIBR|nr:rhamnan synthesis F family protein [Vibrio penaeicida]GLQ74573.1 hypothetical protein GCM10007932_39340 [Vibrio penaeicida]
MKRLTIFAHYDRDDIVDDYVIHYLEELSKVSDDIIFVSVSNISNPTSINRIVKKIIVRENVGYDFMSWQVGLASIDDLSEYDEVIFCNDSCYGPVYPLIKVFDEMKHQSVDFWGITDSNQIAYHLQSYFLVFKKEVFLSDIFNGFLRTIKVEDSKDKIVENYEVGLTKLLTKSGFISGSYLNHTRILSSLNNTKIYKDKYSRIIELLKRSWQSEDTYLKKVVAIKCLFGKYWAKLGDFSLKDNSNIKFVAWKELLDSKDPFVKVMLLRDNPSNISDLDSCYDYLDRNTDYDIDLIIEHLKRIK